MAFSFGTSGSTPQQGVNASKAFASGGLTPFSKALSGSSAFSSPSTIGSVGKQPTRSLSQMVQPTTINHPGLLAAANSHPTSLTTSKDGTVKATYVPPKTTTPSYGDGFTIGKPYSGYDDGFTIGNMPDSNSQPIYSGKMGQGTGSIIPTGQAPDVTSQSAANDIKQQVNSAAPASQRSSDALATTAASSPEAKNFTQQTADYGAGNIGIGQKAEDIANKYSQQIADVGTNAAQGGVGMLTSGALNPVALGRASVIGQNASQEESAIAAAENAALQGTSQALTGQGQAASAANSAAGQAYTGLGLNQSGLTSSANVAQGQQGLTQAGLVAAGGLAQPSSKFSTLGLGQYQTDANGNPVGGGIERALQNNTNYQIANANVGQAVDFGTQASQVSNTLSTMSSVGNQLQDFMTKNGINPANAPIWNSPIQTYLQKVGNPGAIPSFLKYTQDLGNFASQLTQAKGITPTGSEMQTLSADPSTLTGAQLTTYLQTLNNLGQTYLKNLQDSAQGAKNASTQPGLLYQGNSAPEPSALTTPIAPINDGAQQPQWAQFLQGVGLNIGSSLGGGSFSGGLAGGALEQVGSKLLGMLF